MASNNIKLNHLQDAEKNLYNIIKHKKAHHKNSVMVYDDYQTLFHFFMKYDLQKAILLGRALLSKG